MEKLCVELGERSYPIAIGKSADWMPLLAEKLAGRRALIVTDENVDAAGHLEALEKALADAGYSDFQSLILPPGEEHKSLATVELIAEAAVNAKLDRRSVMVALSGGVVGDLTGFAAAVYMRGIDFIQLPTTLLAAVDSSVGGKTGADLAAGKNLVGAFHQPKLVAMDVNTLDTLPPREWRNGLAEVVKYGMIMDAGFFAMLQSEIPRLNNCDPALYSQVILHCCKCKAEVVAGDEQEKGRRAILNYGHTVGHAVEKLSNFTLPHGMAVAIGMAVAVRLAVRMRKCLRRVEDQQNSLLYALGLPVSLPKNSNVNNIIQAMKSDKKNSSGGITMVLPTDIGKVEIVRGVDEKLLAEALENCL
ncbi:MAG: 3-dehydroquinate synthase [Lentisphaerae bacterium]|nr:3-dehydroquinate synthase [Lentisphaerota bacterium]